MRIVDILSEELVLPDVRATSKQALIEEIVGHIAAVRSDVDARLARQVLVERERLGSTGVGNGFAIPHGKLPNLTSVVACLGRSTHGVEFDSLDGQPAYLFLALLAPEGSAGLHLKALARASRLFKNPNFRSALISESDPHTLWEIVCQQDASLMAGDDSRG